MNLSLRFPELLFIHYWVCSKDHKNFCSFWESFAEQMIPAGGLQYDKVHVSRERNSAPLLLKNSCLSINVKLNLKLFWLLPSIARSKADQEHTTRIIPL